MLEFDDAAQQKQLSTLRRREEEELIRVLSGKYGHQYINLLGITIDTAALTLLDEDVAHAAEIAPFEKINKRLRVAIRNPNNEETKRALARLTESGYTLEIFMVSTASLEHAWARYQDINESTANKRGVLDIATDEVLRLKELLQAPQDVATTITSVMKAGGVRSLSAILETILGGGLALHASDVHIEPEESVARIRFRLDGVLADVVDIPHSTYELLRSRIKLIAGLKLNVIDRAQDGRFTIDIGETDLEIRTSVIPGAYGESIVMRILDPRTIGLSMEELGINEKLFSVIEEELHRPNGMIITSGPTGSGKTTSLYAFLKRIHRPEIKVVTLEDPIEYHLEGIVQTQVGTEYTFASGLRAILRQDPDIIMVGEIRDRDVAETAVQAALTGHLVFSTLHTNNAAGGFPRLINLGIDARLIGSAVTLMLAQRLARRLCEHCKKERAATPEEISLIETHTNNMKQAPNLTEPLTVYDAVGCEKCGGVGYRGRVGIYEGIRVDSAVESAVIEDPREEHIIDAAAPQEIPSMQQDGLVKVLAGLTSLEELTRVVDLYEHTEATKSIWSHSILPS